MNIPFTAINIAAALLVAVFLGVRLRRVLPQHHLSAETKDTVKLAMGLVATMSALLLGLLVSSAKSTYDTTRGEVIQMAAKITLIDRALRIYGPEAAPLRAKFRDAMAEATGHMWPPKESTPSQLAPDTQAGNAVYFAIQNLTTQNDMQRNLKVLVSSLALELAQLRTLVMAQSVPSISMPMLVVVISWLFVIFLSFSLLAPANATANVALMVSALSVAGAIFLILELDRPFAGLVRISSEPMVNALGQMTKPDP